MRAIDLFCGAGGASMGLHRAGFDVTGIDWTGQPHYPFSFQCGRVQRLSLKYLRSFDLIWASPPCQAYSIATRTGLNEPADLDRYANDIPWVREMLMNAKVPFIMENVPQAPLRRDVLLCGAMFGLRLVRHRVFECGGFTPRQPRHPDHHWKYVTVAGSTGGPNCRNGHGRDTINDWQEAMGIDWMPMRALSQAVPPAYSEYLAKEFLCDRIHADHADVQEQAERSGSLAGSNEGRPKSLQRRRGDSVAANGSQRKDVDCEPAPAGA